jgi:methionine-rich copper-binding protein CopC
MTRSLTTLAIVVLALLAAALPNLAFAHARLVSSDPAADARLDSAPSAITLVFSEELKPDGNSITVTDAGGAQVDAGDTKLAASDAQRRTITVSLNSGLGDGVYTVKWVNASTDGHSEEGRFSFTVGAAAAPAAPTAALPATGVGDAVPQTALMVLGMLLVGVGLGMRRRGRAA